MVLVGCFALWQYAATAGVIGEAPSRWPSTPAAGIVASPPGTANLLMFAHPRCPCTRASVAELESLARRSGQPATVVFWSPPRRQMSDDQWAQWAGSDLIQLAEQSANLRVVLDPGRTITDAFDARTSGTVLVYDGSGSLRFRGGITSGRGHEGTNQAQAAILAWLKQSDSLQQTGSLQQTIEHSNLAIETFPVFGCEI